MLLGVELSQLFEARHARALRDAGVSAAQEHDAVTVLDRLEQAPGLEIAFRPEIFADFAALLHVVSVRRSGRGGPNFRRWLLGL